VHARPSPNRNTIGVQASLARLRVSQGHSAQSSPPPKTVVTREQQEQAERNRLRALANLHAMLDTSPMQASVLLVLLGARWFGVAPRQTRATWLLAVCLRARRERRAMITGSPPAPWPGPAWIADSQPTSDP
jgi:hypothetical protein